MSESEVRGTVRVKGGRATVELHLPVGSTVGPIDTPRQDGPAPVGGPRPTHSRDFAAVNWYGTVYTFTQKQRLVIAALWRALEEGHKWVGQETLLEVAESDCSRVRDLFRGHPCWGVLVLSAVDYGGPPGAYRLADPPGG